MQVALHISWEDNHALPVSQVKLRVLLGTRAYGTYGDRLHSIFHDHEAWLDVFLTGAASETVP